jgi:CRISPR-associated endonuclease/helicase Cas3
VFRWSLDPDDDSEPSDELRVEVWRAGSVVQGDPAVSRTAQELDAHSREVAAIIARTATDLQMPKSFSQLFEGAATVHDAGKARHLWQRAMGAPRDGRIYAKTAGRSNPRLLQVGGESYRHEFGSLHDAIESARFDDLEASLRDLALHLVVSHHGEARPLIAPVDPDRPPSRCVALAKEVARRFDRLNRALGPWELAWLEALLRAGDWKASAEQQRKAEAR